MSEAQPAQEPPASPATLPSAAQHIDALDRQLAALGAALAERVGGAEAETLAHLELFSAAVQGLEASAQEVAERRSDLLLAAKRLATELRGLDLLAGHVKSVGQLVGQLEAQVQEVVAAAGKPPPAAAQTRQQQYRLP